MLPKWLNSPEFLPDPNKATTDAQSLFYLSGYRSANCGWKKVHCTDQHKLVALNIIVIV